MVDRPLILFRKPDEADKASRDGFATKFSKPNIERQYTRLQPKFTQLQKAWDSENISIRPSAEGMQTEFALVFETIGTVDSFYTAVKHYSGFDWMFDIPTEQIVPDEDFFLLNDKEERKEGELSGKIYCVMTNRKAIEELISLWTKYKENPEMKFERGYAGIRDIFLQLHDIRYWNNKDRIEETGILTYWKESLEIVGTGKINFEMELFFRKTDTLRKSASDKIEVAISSLGGEIINECIIKDISYHCLLASLPREKIKELLDNYNAIKLVSFEDIMFFRPIGQIVFRPVDSASEIEINASEEEVDKDPIVAIFDGYPMQNHALLSNRIVIDDPDGWETGYLVKDRIHGTAMASLVIYGDYSLGQVPSKRRVYLRPVFRATTTADGTYEMVPKDIIFVDLIHRAVKRLFESEGNNPPSAPKIKLISFSIGDPSRMFINMMSPLARLLDWLSNKYRVLFVVSAGNHNTDGLDCTLDFDTFRKLSEDDKERLIIQLLNRDSRYFRLLSPGESINSLTVGALFSDGSVANENEMLAFPFNKALPSPISAIGLGVNRSIKPDIFFNGGKKFLTKSVIGTKMRWAGAENPASRAPGCLAAVPGPNQERSYKAYTFGTSDAAAQVSHEGVHCFDILEDIFLSQNGNSVPDEYGALLIKAMLVHGSSWGDNADLLMKALGLTSKVSARIYRFIGNGSPNITRVEECTDNRVTMIGYGSIMKDKAFLYKVPLPFDFSSERIFRKLTVTLAYFSPIKPSVQKYRSALVWFTLDNSDLFPDRENPEWRATRRTTLQHEIFTGYKAEVWDQSNFVGIKINCVEDASKLENPVPYAIIVSFEVAEGIHMDVYNQVSTRIRQPVTVTT